MLHKTAALPQIDFDHHFALFYTEPSTAMNLMARALARPETMAHFFSLKDPVTQLTYFKLSIDLGEVPHRTLGSLLAQTEKGQVILDNFIVNHPEHSVELLAKEPECQSVGGVLADRNAALLVKCLNNFTEANGDPDAAAVTAVLMQSNERLGSTGAYLATQHLPEFLGILNRNFARMTPPNLCTFLAMLPPQQLYDFLLTPVPPEKLVQLWEFLVNNQQPEFSNVLAHLSKDIPRYHAMCMAILQHNPAAYAQYFQPPPLESSLFPGFLAFNR